MIPVMRPVLKNLVAPLALTVLLSGCSGVVVAGLTLGEILTAGSIGSALLTGKGLGELAMDATTGQDCRILEGVFRQDRAICEPKDSVATQSDFKGLVSLLDTPAGQEVQLADLPMNKTDLPAINPRARANSDKVLSALTGRIVSTESVAFVPNEHRWQRLEREVAFYQPRRDREETVASSEVIADANTAALPAVDRPDLRDRLVKGGLF